MYVKRDLNIGFVLFCQVLELHVILIDVRAKITTWQTAQLFTKISSCNNQKGQYDPK